MQSFAPRCRWCHHAGTLPLNFLQAGCSSSLPINSVKALKVIRALKGTKYESVNDVHTAWTEACNKSILGSLHCGFTAAVWWLYSHDDDGDDDYIDVLCLSAQPAITTSELLRQRNKLRPVTRRDDNDEDGHDNETLSTTIQSSTSDEHVRLLREALERIKKSSGTDTDDNNVDDDDDDDDFVDWSLPHFIIGSIFYARLA